MTLLCYESLVLSSLTLLLFFFLYNYYNNYYSYHNRYHYHYHYHQNYHLNILIIIMITLISNSIKIIPINNISINITTTGLHPSTDSLKKKTVKKILYQKIQFQDNDPCLKKFPEATLWKALTIFFIVRSRCSCQAAAL